MYGEGKREEENIKSGKGEGERIYEGGKGEEKVLMAEGRKNAQRREERRWKKCKSMITFPLLIEE